MTEISKRSFWWHRDALTNLEKSKDILSKSMLPLQMMSVLYSTALVLGHASDYRNNAAHLHHILCSHGRKHKYADKEDGMVYLALILVCLITEPRRHDVVHLFLLAQTQTVQHPAIASCQKQLQRTRKSNSVERSECAFCTKCN